MKKFCLILALAMMLSLCACGGESGESTSAPQQNAQTQTQPTPEPTPEAEVQESQQPDTEPEQDETDSAESDLKSIAMEFVGKPLSELIAAIGQPESSDYAPSCLGEGEDGNLYYDGFTVFTYREGDSETVEYVE